MTQHNVIQENKKEGKKVSSQRFLDDDASTHKPHHKFWVLVSGIVYTYGTVYCTIFLRHPMTRRVYITYGTASRQDSCNLPQPESQHRLLTHHQHCTRCLWFWFYFWGSSVSSYIRNFLHHLIFFLILSWNSRRWKCIAILLLYVLLSRNTCEQ
jgi:hypothetical protein